MSETTTSFKEWRESSVGKWIKTTKGFRKISRVYQDLQGTIDIEYYIAEDASSKDGTITFRIDGATEFTVYDTPPKSKHELCAEEIVHAMQVCTYKPEAARTVLEKYFPND